MVKVKGFKIVLSPEERKDYLDTLESFEKPPKSDVYIGGQPTQAQRAKHDQMVESFKKK